MMKHGPNGASPPEVGERGGRGRPSPPQLAAVKLTPSEGRVKTLNDHLVISTHFLPRILVSFQFFFLTDWKLQRFLLEVAEGFALEDLCFSTKGNGACEEPDKQGPPGTDVGLWCFGLKTPPSFTFPGKVTSESFLGEKNFEI